MTVSRAKPRNGRFGKEAVHFQVDLGPYSKQCDQSGTVCPPTQSIAQEKNEHRSLTRAALIGAATAEGAALSEYQAELMKRCPQLAA